MRVLLASNNPHKVDEFRPLFAGTALEVVSSPEPFDVEETGATFAENALLKAQACARRFGEPAIGDDSGLSVRALGGRPGLYSKRYANTDPERIARVLRELEGQDDRYAEFHCALAIAYPDGRSEVVEGIVPGRIAQAPRGTDGFGYDPVFELPELGKTYAELAPEEKNRLSHRAVATELLLERLRVPT
jgi:XTP/dITP diphosphohydrolase